MSFQDNLHKIIEKHKLIGDKINNPDQLGRDEFVSLSKEYSELSEVVAIINNYLDKLSEIDDLKSIISDGSDAEMKAMAEDELASLERSMPELERNVKLALLPKDKDDEKNAILEVRAGTGGDEAALFAATLFRMYQKYAELRGWRFEVMDIADTGLGGVKEASASISGSGVFARLKFESGVHRVQRVPETESSGRVHTSAATVAVLPEAEDIDIHIEEKDLRIDVFRSSGPGGQSVNTTDSAVRIVHIPTGIIVSQQDEKSQHKNKAKAMKILRAKLYEVQKQAQEAEIAATRKGQVGSGDRSERIRTYNYPQSRVTDHRINLTLYKINEIVNEGELDEVIEALIAEDEIERLALSSLD